MNYSDYGGEILPDGTLQMRDPTDRTRSRYQWRVEGGVLLRRRLPNVGNCWAGETEEPWWEVEHEIPRIGPVHEYWREHGGDPVQWALAHEYWEDVVALTPDGRHVQTSGSGMVIQPKGDNYTVHVKDLKEARDAYYRRRK